MLAAGTTARKSLIASGPRETLDLFPGHNVFRGRVVVQEPRVQVGALGIGELIRGGFIRIDAGPYLFDQRESLLDTELVQAEFFQ